METGQEKFLHFFLDRVEAAHVDEAKKLLVKSFADQQVENFTYVDFEKLQAKLLPLVKEDKVDEVKQAMTHFSQGLAK
ncbi:hypothetical protein [Enterococcus songbeiensis]|uniref:hypothetical protein n=1 Tax=Enterococcus songbeiensis TaxID=2559927 RepID=UPI0010F49399|nr:hypothetical protein [Enterococcus songbeiensis]